MENMTPRSETSAMTDTADPTQRLWSTVLTQLDSDERITPQLHGFINLVEPKGVLAGTLYLEVPNELTRGMLEQRIRVPLLNALTSSTTTRRSPTSRSSSIPRSSPLCCNPPPTPDRSSRRRSTRRRLLRRSTPVGAGTRA
ncbi:hypothetical protein GCM10025881_19890 [Pseudolysinimonas kribbensis]|uniref:Uncharacterized protein n=1 Tax=Pseudolysinimonas kribbensis TaxID=433641 RepID=A0ABQ6K6C5_9MICO|nr:hypothetical protein GCM10025881_19890 [Pseudolysinimonas kribbensis]